METYNLPKGYLSYSAYSLWNKSKDQYRRRYYLNEAPIDTPETRFGKEKHKDMELDDSVEGSETKIEVTVEGIKLLGYLDSLHPENLKVIDFKFSRLSKTGKEPWDEVKVRKHEQFPFYCLMVRELYGKYNPECELHWHETKFRDFKKVVYQGRVYKYEDKNMETTGRVEKFVREVEEWEVDRIKREIIRTALEISNDYTQWTKQN